MVKFLVFMIYKQGLIHDLTHTKLLIRKLFHENEVSFWEVNFHTSDKVKTLEEVELGIDILLILSNCGFKER